MAKKFDGTFSALTDPGRVRINNEDQAKVLLNADGDVLLVVCDGMGGQNKGDYASKMAIDSLTESFRKARTGVPFFFKKKDMERAIKLANVQIFEEADRNPVYAGMGTTLCAALIVKNRIALFNIGDSRAYLSSGDRMKRITSDQTYVNYLFRTGKISQAETESRPDRHVLMNALGIFPSLSMDMSVLEYHGERLLLCTDGLYNNVSEPEISAILATDERVDQKVISLIGTANANGGSDNIGVAYWEAIHD